MGQYKQVISIAIILVLLVLSIYLFLFGPLFPFSPLIIGFKEKEYNKARIYYQQGDSTDEFCIVDSMIHDIENFHHLTFKNKVEIFLTNSDNKYKHITGTMARFITKPLYGRIFISDHAKIEYRNKKIHFETYLKHELSHAILYQNMSLTRSLSYPAWFLEGMAMVAANQAGTDGYYTYEQTKEKIREGYFVEPDDWGTIISIKGKSVLYCKIENKYWFIYSEYALIIHNLIIQYGQEKLIEFLKESLTNHDFYHLFSTLFGQNFDIYLNSIKNQ